MCSYIIIVQLCVEAPPPISQSSSGVTIASGSDEEFSSGEEEVDKGKETRQEVKFHYLDVGFFYFFDC